MALLGAAGCSASDGSVETGGDQAVTGEMRGGDVTVVKAWLGPTLGLAKPSGPPAGDVVIDPNACTADAPGASKTNCTAAAQSVLGSTVVGSVNLDAVTSGQCETLEIRTVTRLGAFDATNPPGSGDFAGLGFYVSSLHGSGDVAKATLVARGDAGRVTLKDGTPAIMHGFVVQGMCFGLGGNGGSVLGRSYKFRPYATFTAGSDTYKVWDDVASDYVLGRTDRGDFVKSFDRSAEVLGP